MDAQFLEALESHKVRFLEAMDDDFNTAQAIGVLFDLSREVNALLSSGQSLARGTLEAIDALYRSLGGEILGLTFERAVLQKSRLEGSLIELLVSTRGELRAAREWELADGIRARLAELGVLLEDRPEGTTWRYEG